jgi:lipopolysaccharide heptosyltransferase II
LFDYLNIYDPAERRLVAAADAALGAGAWLVRLASRRAAAHPRRILLLRLERIGDFLMTLPAIRDVRRFAPDARIDLAVGSWNEPLARLTSEVDGVETLDLPWLARDTTRSRPRWMARGREWRRKRYDLAINFEPDIRSNLLLALSGAGRRAGFVSGGGGGVLTDRLDHDPRRHTAENARRLVARAFDSRAPIRPVSSADIALVLPPALTDAADRRLLEAARHAGLDAGILDRLILIGVHASGGRAIKQWHPHRFAEVAIRLGRERDAIIALTGAAGDRAVVDEVTRHLPVDVRVLDLVGAGDVGLTAAVISRLAILVTGDTGPMHLAAAVGTPTVAVFGPSDPARYAPLGDRAVSVRVDLPCSPCNRIRLPPERCAGHVPACLDGVSVDAVVAASRVLLAQGRRRAPATAVVHGTGT